MLRGLLQADAAPTGSVTDPSQIDVLYRQPLDRSEDTMPNSARWWADKTEEYAGWLRQESGLSDGYLRRNRRYLVAFRRDRERAGIAPPEGPTDVGREHIRAAKGCGLWGPRTLKTKFSVLRGFL